MKRKDKELKVLDAGDKRRIYDGRNAYRKMTDEQRVEMKKWQKAFDKGEVA